MTHTVTLTHTYTSGCVLSYTHAYLERLTRTHIQKHTCKLEHALTQTHFSQMDRCCTSRGTETQQLFPSQSDGLPLVLHEYFTLIQNGCIPDSYNSSHTGPDDQIIKLYGRTSSHCQLEKKLLEYFLAVRTKAKSLCLIGVILGDAGFVV